MQVTLGGESFVSLAEGLQNAIHASGGTPQYHRTDSLSAAYRNLGKQTAQDLTNNYQGLCQHYQMRPTRNNRGVAHENGSIESSHGHFKRRLHQALLLRGSCDFDSIESYQQLIHQVVSQLNATCHEKFIEEQQYLQPLPIHRFRDYEVISVKVTRQSTITIRCILYTVPSQLIGHRLTIHLYHNRLMGFVGNQKVVELPRIYVPTHSSLRRARCINYRHVIDSLRRKPRAFLHCSWQQDLLPTEQYRRIWCQLQAQFDPDDACRLMVESLYIAAIQDRETTVANYLEQQLASHRLTLTRLQQQFHLPQSSLPQPLTPTQHPLSNYDQLLNYELNSYTCNRQSPPTVEVSQTASCAADLA